MHCCVNNGAKHVVKLFFTTCGGATLRDGKGHFDFWTSAPLELSENLQLAITPVPTPPLPSPPHRPHPLTLHPVHHLHPPHLPTQPRWWCWREVVEAGCQMGTKWAR